MIRFDQVGVTYQGAVEPALRGVDLTVPEGELCLLVGPSGAGKSTLLGTVCGLVPHFTGGTLHGRVTVDGRDTRTHKPRELADVVGTVGQDPLAHFVTDTVEDELAYGMESLGLPPQVMRRRVEETLDLLGIASLRDRPLASLSGGQQQRVAIGSVLTPHPRVLVLDEPTSALDPGAAEEVLAVLQRLVHDLGTTVLMAEHRLERVVQYADQVLLLPARGAAPVMGDPAALMEDSPVRPPVVELGRLGGWSPLPLSVRDARRLAAPLRERLAASRPTADGRDSTAVPEAAQPGADAPRPGTGATGAPTFTNRPVALPVPGAAPAADFPPRNTPSTAARHEADAPRPQAEDEPGIAPGTKRQASVERRGPGATGAATAGPPAARPGVGPGPGPGGPGVPPLPGTTPGSPNSPHRGRPSTAARHSSDAPRPQAEEEPDAAPGAKRQASAGPRGPGGTEAATSVPPKAGPGGAVRRGGLHRLLPGRWRAGGPEPAGDRAGRAPVEAAGMSVRRGRTEVLRRLDLTVRPGETVALMGRNGAGKSTLLRTLVGMHEPTAGSLLVGGAVPHRSRPSELLHLAGLVPQEPRDLLYADTVAAECAAADEDARAAAGTCRRLVERLLPGVPDDTHPRDLSEGQRLALALSIVLTAAPPLVLLDEPTRGLDYAAKARLVTVLRELAAAGHAIVLATHDVELAAELAHRVVILADGDAVADGPAAEVVTASPAYAPQIAKVLAPQRWLTLRQVRTALTGTEGCGG